MRVAFRNMLCLFWLFSLGCANDAATVNFACGEGAVFDCNTCSDNFEPVCGCDEVTYRNACTANCNGVYEYTTGECP